MTVFSEPDLVLPSLAILDQEPGGLTTTELISLLTEALRPGGRDAALLRGRRDSHFSQKVRNLLGVRKTLFVRGWTSYDANRHLHVITPAGTAYLEQQRAELGRANPATRRQAERIGTRFGDYRRANETPRGRRRAPFTIDPDLVDRASGAHGEIQNALAIWVTGQQLKPLRWTGGLAEFDLAWLDGSTLYVAEVKSLTAANEIRQLRLGLGQVLHYQALLRATVPDVQAVLAVERAPRDRAWLELCANHGVSLVWPEMFDSLVRTLRGTGARG